MEIQPMVLGEADGEIVSLRSLEQTRHVLILSGKSKSKPRKILSNALYSQVSSGGGLIYMQVESDNTKSDLINAVAEFERAEDLIELQQKHLEFLPNLIESAMLEGKILYIEMIKTNGAFQKALIKALYDASEKFYQVCSNSHRPRPSFMIAACQVHRILEKEWRNLSIFARRNNVSLITLIDSFADIKELSENKDFYITLDYLLDNSFHKVIFPQETAELNTEVTRYFSLPRNYPKQGLIGWLTRKTQKPTLIDELKARQYIYLQGDDLYVLDLVD